MDHFQPTSLTDVLDLDDIQRFQDLFADVHGVASLITDTKGKPITQPSNFTRLCADIIRNTEKGCAKCFESDAILGRHNPEGAVAQPCLSAGLWDAGVSITVKGQHIANWLIGQVRNEEMDEAHYLQYADEIGADKAAFKAALKEVPVMQETRFRKIADLLFIFANELSEKAFGNWQLKNQIAENEKINALLQEREEDLSTTLHSIGDGVISTDKNGLVVKMNPIAEKLCGWTLADARERPLTEIFHIVNADTRKLVINPVHQVLQNGNIVGLANHTVLISKNGTEYQIADSAAPIKNKNGDISGVVLVFSDVTEQYAAEKQIRDDKMRFKNLLEHLEAGIVVHAPDTSVKYSNPRACEILGLSPNQMMGKTGIDPTWKFVDEWGHPLPLEKYPVNQITTNQQPIKNFIGGICHPKNSSILWVTINGFPSFDHEGLLSEIIISFFDISERKQINEKLLAAKEKAEESDRLKSAFLANMSHEIRTPMNGILGFADLLKQPGLTGEKQQTYLKIIKKSGVRMLNIINNIIDISKIESGLMQLNIDTLNINQKIEYVYTFFKPEAEAKGLKFSVISTLPKAEVNIRTDREKLYGILTNLVKNALKHTAEGTIEFGYQLKTANGSAELEFFVKDTGIGIPEDRQEAIFQRFVQADIADKMAYQGAGLGLSISKAYVEMLGGKIWVHSEEAKGTTFYFTLPYNVEPESASLVESSQSPLTPSVKTENVRKLTILIAEDDVVSQILLGKMVKLFAKTILKAGNGVDAVAACRNNPDIDLVLMDIQMPGLNGYEATRQIRHFNKEVIIIAQTAYGLSGDRRKSLEAGCNDYISKPINAAELRALIQKHFRK